MHNDPPLHGLAMTIVPKGGVTLFVILLPEVHPGQHRHSSPIPKDPTVGHLGLVVVKSMFFPLTS